MLPAWSSVSNKCAMAAVLGLDTYGHLWPDSDDRTQDAIDCVLGSTADPLRTEAMPNA